METLKVGSKSNPNSVAGALANVFREKGTVEIQAIGVGALNKLLRQLQQQEDLLLLKISFKVYKKRKDNRWKKAVILLVSL